MTPQEACNFPLDLENHYGYIYCLTFPSSKKYIGQTIKPWKERWKRHKNAHSCCRALKSALAKYAEVDICWELLSYADSLDELNALECSFICKFNTLAPSGYNLKDGGEGHRYSEETRKKISISNILAHHKKGHFGRIKQSKSSTKAQNTQNLNSLAEQRYIDKHYKEHLDRGFNIISFITAQNENICLTTAQYNSKIHTTALYKDPVKGKALREKLSRIQQQMRSRPVYCVELNETFSSPTEAVKKHPEWNKSKINACCLGTNSTHQGLHFYHPDDPPERLEKLKLQWKTVELKKHNPPTNIKSVICIETGKFYSSQRAAAKDIFKIEDEATAGAIASQIGRVAKGQRKTYNGLHFTYAQDPLQ